MTTLPPGTLARAREAFVDLRDRLAAGDLRIEDVAASPVLLRDGVAETVATAVAAADLDEDPAVQRLTATIIAVRERFSGPRAAFRYPLGTGPVEGLWHRLDSAKISPTAAVAAAAALPITESLTPAYVEALLRDCGRQADVGSWRAVRTRTQLVLTAVEASPPEETALREAADRGFVRSARGLLRVVPDRRVLERADQGGRRLLAALPDGSPEAAEQHAELAALWGDPYTADRTSETWSLQDQQWRQRGWEELSRRDGRPVEDWGMPAGPEALRTALMHWRSAYEAAPGRRIVVGWAEAAATLADLTHEPVDPSVTAAVTEQLAALDGGDGDGGDTVVLDVRLRAVASWLGLDAGPQGTAGLDVVDLDGLVGRHGTVAAQTALRIAGLLEGTDPASAVRVLERFGPVFASAEHSLDLDATNAARELARVLHLAAGLPELPGRVPGQAFGEYAEEVLGTLADSGADPGSFAVMALRLAVNSVNDASEAVGLQLLGMIESTAPLFHASHRWALDNLAGTLYLGEGVNRHHAGDDTVAAVMYARALQLAAQAGRRGVAAELLDRLADIASDADNDAATDVIGRIVGSAPLLLARLGPTVDARISFIMSRVLGGLVRQERVNLDVLWALLQFGSGLRTAMELGSDTGPDPTQDATAGPLLQQLVELSGSARAEASSSVRAAVQARLRELALEKAREPSLIDTEQLRRAIDDRTVVLATATATDRDGAAGRLALLLWDDGQAPLFTGMLPAGQDVPPWPLQLGEQLAALAGRGKDHLCVFGDAGLEVVRWHLVDLGDGPLAERWVVTVLPHPHLLLQGRRGAWVAARPRLPVVAFGLADAGPGWDLLEDAEDEARTVAAALGGLPVCGEDATETSFRALAGRARYVHAATHGVFDADNPAFHAVLLSPDEHDGALQAWEVARLDLSAVRLVTLSACESAQLVGQGGGSVDGLPIAFLAAGARAVIGPQIAIETGQSRYFFEHLYAQLAAEPDLRDAFRSARDATRKQFPGSQAWGSFYLVGDWR